MKRLGFNVNIYLVMDHGVLVNIIWCLELTQEFVIYCTNTNLTICPTSNLGTWIHKHVEHVTWYNINQKSLGEWG